MKLDIQPFSIGLEIKAAYDSKNKKVYENIKIDKEGFKLQLITAFMSAKQFAVNLSYACQETIIDILAKAQREALAVEKLIKTEQPAEQPSQSPVTEAI